MLLHRRGFVTLHPQDLPFDEQIRLFKRARVAIGPTGAAFSNMIYAAPGSQLIELMPTGSWQPPQIEFLMQAADITYANIPVPGAFEDTRLHVDVDEVGRRLGELGIT